jgi:hypothetical protein
LIYVKVKAWIPSRHLPNVSSNTTELRGNTTFTGAVRETLQSCYGLVPRALYRPTEKQMYRKYSYKMHQSVLFSWNIGKLKLSNWDSRHT